MVYEICAIIAIIIFAILAFYICKILTELLRTMHKINAQINDINAKSKKLDSTLQSISNIGEITEDKTESMREEYFLRKKLKLHERDDIDSNEELVDLIVTGLRFGAKFFMRR
jgi:uncharacterized protein YoxC